MPSANQQAAARAFVRRLNVLLKSARLYGVAHGRTAEQTRAAWDEFRTLLKNGEGGVTFGVAGTQLLLDGAPLEDGPPERSFAELLSAAGLASLQFTPRVTAEDFARLISAFATAGGKVAGLAEHLKKTLAASGEASIRINEVRFVAEDAALGEGGAGKLLAGSFGLQPGDIERLVSDPQRLLQLIAAAQGAQSATGTQSTASAEPEGAASRDGWISSPASGPAREEDVLHLFRLVTGMAQASKSAEPQAVPITQQMGELSANAQQLFQQGLAALAKVAPAQRPDTPMLLQLAEHLAIRFALERFDRGEVKVNAVREMLERASGEMATLRKVLAVQEERMARAGLEVESHADVLDRQFWTTVPDSGKRAVLLSAEAWCIPPRNVRQFVEQLLQRGDAATAGSILENYTSCVGHEDAQVRLKVAAGLTDVAGLYARCAGRQLSSAVRCIAEQMRWESDDKIREVLAGAYNRLAQEAATRRDYATLHMAMRYMETPVDGAAAAGAKAMPQISIVDRLPELVDDALRSSKIAPDLAAVLARTPQATADRAAARFAACTRRDQCQRLFGLFAVTGEKGVAHLSHLLRSGADTQAAATVGLLSQFAPATAEELLPLRLPQWNRSHHDTVVRQLGAAASPSRGRLLARIFTQLDKRVLPEAVDEIGMSQDTLRTSALLLRLARGEAAQAADPLVRVKAIEALGRLRIAAIVPYLRSVLESRRMLAWEHHGEMRIVAAQALSRIDPQWMRDFRARSGLAAEHLALAPLDFSPDTPWARQRRYTRVAPQRAVDAVAESARGDCKWNATLLSLGGGMAVSEFPLPAGSQVAVKLRAGLRRVEAQALVRDTVKEQVGFEIVEMSLEERNKLRRLITGFQSRANPSRVLG